MTEFCMTLGYDPPQTLEIVGVIVWPLLLETELREKRDSLRWVGVTECLIYSGSRMGNDLIIELVSS